MTSLIKTDYLIIGNSVGGIGAAEAIRENDGAGYITIVSDESYHAYSRPLISDYLAHPGPVEKMLYRRPDFYEKNGISTLLGEKVIKINPEGHTVMLSGGQNITWRRLLLATGGTPIVPATPGADLKGVFTFNKLDDARAIDEFLKGRLETTAVVIGGGLIGVSVTEALVKRGVRVTVVELKDRVLNTILDEESSARETQALTLSGVSLITGHSVSRISSGLRGQVSGVAIDDGRMLGCDLVVFAVGVRPRLELAKDAGIKTNRGITVDRFMMTSAPGIYACGDAAEAYDFVLGEDRPTPVWPNAYEGGRVAGLNMAGVPTEYKGGTALNALKYFGVNIVSAGMVASPDASAETLSFKRNGIYRKVVIKHGKLVGLIFAGDIAKSGIVYNLMKDRIDVTDFKEALVADNFGLASLPEAIWQERLPRSTAGSVIASGASEEPEEALIGD